MAKKQIDMFGNVVTDMSLFSGTAMTGHEEQFNPPSEVMRMDSMFGCNICHGTGWIKPKKNKQPVRCTCEAGNVQKKKDMFIDIVLDAIKNNIEETGYCIVCDSHDPDHADWCGYIGLQGE